MKTEIAPLLIMTKLEQFDYAGATAVALILLLISLHCCSASIFYNIDAENRALRRDTMAGTVPAAVPQRNEIRRPLRLQRRSRG